MAIDRTKKPGGSGGDQGGPPLSPLERYLAKQKQEKVAQAAREAPAPKARAAFGKTATSPTKPTVQTERAVSSPSKASAKAPSNEKPSLAGIERPPQAEAPQPASLRRWESVADDRLGDNQQKAREAGVPTSPPPYTPVYTPQSEQQVDHDRPITENHVDQDGQANADFGPRFVAAMIDWLVVMALTYAAKTILLAVLAVVFGSLVESHRDGLASLISLLVIYAYYGYFYPVKKASPGKLLMGLEVVDTNGVTPLTPWKAFFREAIGKFISAVPFFMGYVIIAIRRDHRALHDLLFDTRVIRKDTARA